MKILGPMACTVLLAFTLPTPAQTTAKVEWLPLCGKCLEPSIFSKTGIGTAHAVAEAKVTYQDAKEHCENWSLENNPDCDKGLSNRGNRRYKKERMTMRIMKKAVILMATCGMLTPMLPAQSVWQKMKKAAKQVEQNAQAQQHKAQPPTSTNATPAQAAAQSQPATQASSPPADLSSPGLEAANRKLEVGGVWLGMPSDAAQAAILKRNPKLTASPHHFGFAEVPSTAFTDQVGFSQKIPDYSSTVEVMDLGLTLQPMPLEVAFVSRHTEYSETDAPTIANTVEALRAKYGAESVILPKDPTSTTTYIWFFDGSGKQVKPTDRWGVIAACGQSSPLTVLLMLKQNQPSTTDQYCSNLTVLAAALEEWTPRRTLHNGQTMPPGVLFQMSVTAISNPLLEKSTADTRNMLISARNGEQQKKKNSAGQNKPVL